MYFEAELDDEPPFKGESKMQIGLSPTAVEVTASLTPNARSSFPANSFNLDGPDRCVSGSGLTNLRLLLGGDRCELVGLPAGSFDCGVWLSRLLRDELDAGFPVLELEPRGITPRLSSPGLMLCRALAMATTDSGSFLPEVMDLDFSLQCSKVIHRESTKRSLSSFGVSS
jgi:hypothetical protein